MTTVLGRGRRLAGRDGLAEPGLSDVSLSPPSRRRPTWIVLGMVLVGFAGMVGAYVLAAASDTLAVTVAARDLAPGDVLGPADIRVVEMGRTGELRAVQADQQNLIVGLAALGPIPAGTVLNTGLFVPEAEAVPAGKVVVGGAFPAGAVPIAALRPGVRVGLHRVVSERAQVANADVEVEAVDLGLAMVWSVDGEVSVESSSQRLWVSLLVDEVSSTAISQAAADERLRLVLVP
ncbi:MAG TPA: SAF domain-containing protein [Ilumatobacter sp.]|nr:SAF domain-containing protein [Ilumatobacter sp.]